MSNKRDKATYEGIKYAEKHGILDKAGRMLAAAHLITQIADKMFFSVQDELYKCNLIHRELKRNWNNMVHCRDLTMGIFVRDFYKDERQRESLMEDFEEGFSKICSLFHVENEAEFFCGLKLPKSYLHKECDDEITEVRFKCPKYIAQALSDSAKREEISRSAFIADIVERVAAFELQKQASEQEREFHSKQN